MELLKNFSKKSLLGEIAYIALNILFALAVLLVVRYTGSAILAITLVLLSKWRVFAVRPRYWLTNMQSNLVDVIVSISLVAFMLVIGATERATDSVILSTQLLITALHIAWLVWVKPMSSRFGAALQAAVALAVGSAAIFIVGYSWWIGLIVLCMWALGYITARHVLTTYQKEDHLIFLCLVWGLILAQIGWVAYHWAIAYPVPIIDSVRIPQVSIIVVALAVLAHKAYDSFADNGEINVRDIFLPLLLSVGVVAVLLIFFSTPHEGIW